MKRAVVVLTVVVVLAVSASACGKKGPLEPPPTQTEESNRR
ncbi:MAG TPA: hypothetical protein QF665_05830 [Alphaproteobacteria bacterium]|jgi:predicted small lipoprotein YifL|nr:hypothetical protein [Alphaproteobacteria bacterium]